MTAYSRLQREVAEWAVARPICGSSGFRRDDQSSGTHEAHARLVPLAAGSAKISVELARTELGRSKRKAHLGLAVVVTNVSFPNADLDPLGHGPSKINLGAVIPIFGSMSLK
jgi:hypothetical protein